MRVDKLNTFEQETLNRFLLHHMGLETRRKLMVEYPVIYRKLLAREDDAPFRAAVKAAVLGKCCVYSPSASTRELGCGAAMLDGEFMGLPIRCDVNQELQAAIDAIEEDE